MKNKFNIVIYSTALNCLLVLLLSSCSNNLVTNSPSIVSTEIAIPSPVTLLPTSGTDDAAVVAYPTLGTIQYLQYSYSLIHNYDFDSCTFNPYVCPDVYNALLSDVHTWTYIQAGQTAWLEFKLDEEYQIKPSEENNIACAVTQNIENMNMIGITCGKVGEYTLKFDLVNEEQHLTYPLILHFINVPELSPPPPVITPHLSVEEHELIQHPDTDPLFFKPIIGNSNTILAKHDTERGQLVAGVYSIYLDDGQLIRAEETSQATGLLEPSHVLNITITQSGNKIFAKQAPVSPISAFRGLWSIENHWFAEIAVTQDDSSFRSITQGDIFKDGISFNETFGYTESFGFQILHRKPFYFFEKFGRIGISYNGQDMPLGYDKVPHHECCSLGELNPKMYENMVGFFAVRGDKWYYVEIGIFE